MGASRGSGCACSCRPRAWGSATLGWFRIARASECVALARDRSFRTVVSRFVSSVTSLKLFLLSLSLAPTHVPQHPTNASDALSESPAGALNAPYTPLDIPPSHKPYARLREWAPNLCPPHAHQTPYSPPTVHLMLKSLPCSHAPPAASLSSRAPCPSRSLAGWA